MNDPISDLVTQIKNASMAGLKKITLPHSIMKEELSKILKTEGFLTEVEQGGEDKKKQLTLILVQKENKVPVLEVKRISKPGRRVYIKSKDIKKMRGIGLTVISTPEGLMTSRQALKKNLGGEVICKIVFV